MQISVSEAKRQLADLVRRRAEIRAQLTPESPAHLLAPQVAAELLEVKQRLIATREAA